VWIVNGKEGGQMKSAVSVIVILIVLGMSLYGQNNVPNRELRKMDAETCNLRDRNGVRVAEGVYFIRCVSEGQTIASGKAIVF
jgi:hypothetical protein